MAQSPLVVLMIVLATLAFEGVLFETNLVDQSFPKFEQPDKSRDCSGLNGIGCFFEVVFSVLKLVWGVIVFLFNLVTFNVPGAPWYVRFVLGGSIIGMLVWSVATLVRGN